MTIEFGAHMRSSRFLSEKHLWRVLWSLSREHARLAGGVVALSVLAAGLPLTLPGLYAELIDTLINKKGSPLAVVAVVAAVAFLAQLAVVAFVLVSARLAAAMRASVQRAMFRAIQLQPLQFFKVTAAGSVVQAFTSDADRVGRVVTTLSTTVLVNVVTVILAVSALIWIHPLLSVSVVPILPAAFPINRLERRTRSLGGQLLSGYTRQAAFVSERVTVAGDLLSRIFGQRRSDADEVGALADEVSKATVSLSAAKAFAQGIAATATNTSTVVAAGIAVHLQRSGSISLGEVIATVFLVRVLEQPVVALLDSRYEIVEGFIALKRVDDVVRAAPEPHTPADLVEFDSGPGARVRLNAVSYQYPRRQDVLIPSLSAYPDAEESSTTAIQDVTLIAEPGETIALVGPTGSGKSTVALLMSGLVQPTTGRVTVAGVEPHRIPEELRRTLVGFVAQDAYLLHDTIRANILLGLEDVEERQFMTACIRAGVHEFCNRLPARYNTIVGEGGHRLSGGERQRVALARALLSEPRLVILDEPTAHLDNITEKAIQSSLESGFAGATRVVIAHRLSTVRHADRILVLNQGLIVEEGAHDELIRAGGLYAELHRDAVPSPILEPESPVNRVQEPALGD